MEKLTSEVFKSWQRCCAACQSVKQDAVSQGTAEDRVTAVNNELARTSLTRGVSVFDADGRIAFDLKLLLVHLKAIKAFLDMGRHLKKRNKYGMDAFITFVQWLLKNPQLDTHVKVRNFLNQVKKPNSKSQGTVVAKLPCQISINDALDKMGASWFVSYAYYKHIDTLHNSWKNVSAKSLKSRSAKYKASEKMHHTLLRLILKMDDAKIETNGMNLTASEVRRMARKLLKKTYAN